MPSKKMPTSHIDQDATVVAELVRLFPNDPMSSIVHVLDMPPLQRNAAVWKAMELGFIDHQEKSSDLPPRLGKVDKIFWEPEVERLKESILYALKQVAVDEEDISEGQLTIWLTGNKAHWIAIALRQLIEERSVVTYEAINQAEVGKGRKKKVVEDSYLFYALPENAHNHWGLKQFPDQSRVRLVVEGESSEV